jgi:hypothetical protein
MVVDARSPPPQGSSCRSCSQLEPPNQLDVHRDIQVNVDAEEKTPGAVDAGPTAPASFPEITSTRQGPRWLSSYEAFRISRSRGWEWQGMLTVEVTEKISCTPDELLDSAMDVERYAQVDRKIRPVQRARRDGNLTEFCFRPRLVGIPAPPSVAPMRLTPGKRIDITLAPPPANRMTRMASEFDASFVCTPGEVERAWSERWTSGSSLGCGGSPSRCYGVGWPRMCATRCSWPNNTCSRRSGPESV